MPYETRVCLAVRWFLGSHDISSATFIHRLAAALLQQVGLLVLMELIPDEPNKPCPKKTRPINASLGCAGQMLSVRTR